MISTTYIIVSSDLTTTTVVCGDKDTTAQMDYRSQQAHHEMAELCCQSYPDCDIIVLEPESAIRRNISLQDISDLCVLAEFGY